MSPLGLSSRRADKAAVSGESGSGSGARGIWEQGTGGLEAATGSKRKGVAITESLGKEFAGDGEQRKGIDLKLPTQRSRSSRSSVTQASRN